MVSMDGQVIASLQLGRFSIELILGWFRSHSGGILRQESSHSMAYISILYALMALGTPKMACEGGF